MKIAFIGGGNMGEAMLAAILRHGVAGPESVTVSDISPERQQQLARQYGVATTDDNLQAIAGSDVIVLAIKPQNLGDVMAELRGRIGSAQLVVSVIAGATVATLSGGLGHASIVRAMPNTPAQIGQGTTAWTATPDVTTRQRQWGRAILGAMGQEFSMDGEDGIDMATAVSGSGPAYVFYFVEALTDAGARIGLDRDTAADLALGTVLGAGHLIAQSGRDPAELRRMVTSPGGTTAAALAVLDDADFSGTVGRAVEAAHARARELGDHQ